MKVIAALALVLATGVCHANDIYRWVDEQGRAHMADSVPDRYRDVAKKIDARQFKLSESDQSAAAARLARDRDRLAALEARRAQAEAGQSPGASPAEFGSAGGASKNKSGTECDGLWGAYRESEACFARYQFRNGTKTEGFAHCKPVLSPSQQCGPAKNAGLD